MNRRLMSAVAAVIVCLAPGLVVPGHAATTRECLSTTQQPSVAAYRRCTNSCSTGFAKRLAACFGPGRSCIRACQKTRDACEAPPQASLSVCQDSTDPTSCSSRLGSALAACAADPDPFQCRVTARVDRVTCDEACVGTQVRAIETCVEAAVVCEGRCPFK
jgi:hypothetical protein